MSDTSLGADISAAMSGSTSTADPSSTAASTADTSASPGAATTEPAQASTATAQTEPTKQGPIPFDVHSTALDNARKKAVAEYQAKYGWAESIQETEFREAVRLAQRVSADPIAHVTELIAELQAHPTHSQTLESLAAKALSAGRGGTTTTMPEPDVAITDEQGNVVGQAFSAKATTALVQHAVSQALAAHRQELAPVIKTHETVTAERQKAVDAAEGDKFASGLITEVSQYPHFEQHKEAIGREVARVVSAYPKDDPRVNDPAFLEATLLRAYTRIVTPTLNASARQSVLSDLTTKATANTVSPNAPSTGSTKAVKDMSYTELFQAELAGRR